MKYESRFYRDRKNNQVVELLGRTKSKKLVVKRVDEIAVNGITRTTNIFFNAFNYLELYNVDEFLDHFADDLDEYETMEKDLYEV